EHGEVLIKRFPAFLSNPLIQYNIYIKLGYMYYLKSDKEKELSHSYGSYLEKRQSYGFYLEKADDSFCKAIAILDISSSYTCYAEFLVKCNRLDDAVKNLLHTISKGIDMGT